MTLGEYIESFIGRNKLTIREFARHCGVNHQVIFNILNKPDYRPGVETLEKISEYTGVKIITLLQMVYPEVFEDMPSDVTSDIVAKAFKEAPENVQDLVLRLIGLK